MRTSTFFLLSLLAFSAPILRADEAADAQNAKDALVVETLIRLEKFDLAEMPKQKAAVLRQLEANKETPRYLELAEQFSIKETGSELLRLALEKSPDALGVGAARLLLKLNGSSAVATALADKDDRVALKAVTAFGATQDKAAIEPIAVLVTDKSRSGTVRNAAVKALGGSPTGEQLLLAVVKGKKLPADSNFSAASVLLSSRDPAVKEEAAKFLTLPPGSNAKPLPPVAELALRKGDAAVGKAVFQRTCIACHKIDGIPGVDFGPALSEIGDKLPKDALYTAILDPSAGIEFNYEGYLVKLKDGNQALGIITSQTDDKITLKLLGGTPVKYNKADIVAMEKQATSLMPPGLQQAMTEQELTDLVEFLSSLKKKK
jgi:putative heme-binding domain-containing protein